MAAVKFDVVRSIVFSSIGVSYTAIGTPLTQNWRIIKVTSTLDFDVLVSLDAVNDNMFIPAGGFTLYDFSTNEPSIAANDNMVIGKGTQFYVKTLGALTYGVLYIEGVYS